MPYENTTSYLVRVIASENNTVVRVDNGTPSTLSSGQYIDFLNSSSPLLITGSKPIAVSRMGRYSLCTHT